MAAMPRGVDACRRLREPKRLMQLHLDWILMGPLLLAIGGAVPRLSEVLG
jgi:hypothetical protein